VICVIVTRCQSHILCNLNPVNGVELAIARAGGDDRELITLGGCKVTKQFNV